MEGLRVVLRDNAVIEDSSRVILSIDELYKILTWANSDYFIARTESGGRTWRTVPGLSLRQVRQGSSIFEMFPALSPEAQAAILGGTVSAVGIVAKWMFGIIDPKRRAEARALNAEAKAKEIANELAEDMNPIAVRRAQFELHREMQSASPIRVIASEREEPLGEPETKHALAPLSFSDRRALGHSIAEILQSGEVGEEYFDGVYRPARRRQVYPEKAFRATQDAASVYRRVVRYQQASHPVIRIEVIDDGQ